MVTRFNVRVVKMFSWRLCGLDEPNSALRGVVQASDGGPLVAK